MGETVDHRAGGKVLPDRGPGRTQAVGGEERDHRLGDVGQVAGDHVTGAHAGLPKDRERTDLVAQLCAGQFGGGAGLVDAEDRDGVGGARISTAWAR